MVQLPALTKKSGRFVSDKLRLQLNAMQSYVTTNIDMNMGINSVVDLKAFVRIIATVQSSSLALHQANSSKYLSSRVFGCGCRPETVRLLWKASKPSKPVDPNFLPELSRESLAETGIRTVRIEAHCREYLQAAVDDHRTGSSEPRSNEDDLHNLPTASLLMRR